MKHIENALFNVLSGTTTVFILSGANILQNSQENQTKTLQAEYFRWRSILFKARNGSLSTTDSMNSSLTQPRNCNSNLSQTNIGRERGE